MVLLGIGMIGDAFTTFFGILIALGALSINSNNIAQFVFAIIGTSIIIGLNLATLDVFERKQKIIFLIWLPAVIIDFIASLVGSFGMIKPGANPFLSYGLVFIITMFITASPCLLRYFKKNPIY